MIKLAVYDMGGGTHGEMEIAEDVLVRKRGVQAVHDVAVAFLAGARAGTASTLRKGEVAGSGRKPWKQKGTGRARAGYRQSPVWRGGSVAFGPHPRSYVKKVTTKTRRLAFRRALSDRITEGAVRVLDKLEFAEPKTKQFMNLLKSFDLKGAVLVVVANKDKRVALASRNIPLVELTTAGSLNTYQVLRYPSMLVTKDAMGILTARMSGEVREVAT